MSAPLERPTPRPKKPPESEATPAADAAGTPAPVAAEPSSAPVEVADIDRWEKGMAGELEAVQQAAAKLKTARSGRG